MDKEALLALLEKLDSARADVVAALEAIDAADEPAEEPAAADPMPEEEPAASAKLDEVRAQLAAATDPREKAVLAARARILRLA